MATLTVGSLFAGIGGIDLGLQRAGHRVVWHSEIDKYAIRVLKKTFPEVPNLGDITKIEWNIKEHYVDILAGGYPCQPFSTAGKRKGKEDRRHLWPYFLDAIRTIRPRYALLENVRGHLSLGFGDVLADLAACGYSAEWQVIPASSIGAPHRRDRLIVVAYPDRERSHPQEIYAAETRESSLSDSAGPGREMADAEVFGGDEREHRADSQTISGRRTIQGETRRSSSTTADSDGGRDEREAGTMADAEIFFGDGGRHRHGEKFAENDPGLSDFLSSRRASGSENFGIWQTEPDVGRVADGIPARVDRLRGLGNAVVPQLAELIGILIAEHAEHN